MTYSYKTTGTCSTKIVLELEGDRIQKVSFHNGCPGNLLGLSALVEGQKIDDVIGRLKGIRCGMKKTSCPDQLALALEQAKAELAAG